MPITVGDAVVWRNESGRAVPYAADGSPLTVTVDAAGLEITVDAGSLYLRDETGTRWRVYVQPGGNVKADPA